MKLRVSKFHGTGNDHLLVDDRNGALEHITPEQVRFLCDRKYGIGSDGLILLRDHDTADLEMVFYNPDASQSFCGNGSRCLMAFCEQLDIPINDTSFMAIDGIHKGRKEAEGYAIKMRDVPIASIESVDDARYLDTGSPHYVSFVEELEGLDIIARAHEVRYNERFEEQGTNVNFVIASRNEAWVRTYERGVENETLSCGTGVTAVALAVASKGLANEMCRIHTQGGELEVRFQRTENGFEDVWMSGPAIHVFDAEIEI